MLSGEIAMETGLDASSHGPRFFCGETRRKPVLFTETYGPQGPYLTSRRLYL